MLDKDDKQYFKDKLIETLALTAQIILLCIAIGLGLRIVIVFLSI